MLSRLLFLALLLLPLGCRSTSTDSDIPCNCGTPEAAMQGCLHPKCVSGEGNPDNPECVCGTLSIKPN
jgi:hypothetical protein